jgi:hypothetical protein
LPLQRSLIGWVAGPLIGRERKSEYAAGKTTASRCSGNHAKIRKLPPMKMAKAIRQQAATAEQVAVNTADTYVASQMRTLAQAFRTQAEIIKKNKKKKKK